MRIREPKTTALIFASGKMVVTGAKSEDDSKLASRKYARIIQKLGFNAKFTDFKIQNIVGSCDIKFPIRLEGLASRHHHFSSYEPELFPGLIYRMIKPKIVLLIFVSGKIVLTGAKVREEIYQAFEMIYPVLSGKAFSSSLGVILAELSQIFESPSHPFDLDSWLAVDHSALGPFRRCNKKSRHHSVVCFCITRQRWSLPFPSSVVSRSSLGMGMNLRSSRSTLCPQGLFRYGLSHRMGGALVCGFLHWHGVFAFSAVPHSALKGTASYHGIEIIIFHMPRIDNGMGAGR